MPISTVTNEDCMIMMSRYPDKFFELAIVDPPYFEKGGTPEYYRSRLGASNHKPIIDTWVNWMRTISKRPKRDLKNRQRNSSYLIRSGIHPTPIAMNIEN